MTKSQQIALAQGQIMIAWANGETIEYRPVDIEGSWQVCRSNPQWNWVLWDYRVKLNVPEQLYLWTRLTSTGTEVIAQGATTCPDALMKSEGWIKSLYVLSAD